MGALVSGLRSRKDDQLEQLDTNIDMAGNYITKFEDRLETAEITVQQAHTKRAASKIGLDKTDFSAIT